MLDKRIRSLTGETVMTLYIGVDFHAHQQTVSWCDTATGETDAVELKHDLKEVREFYGSFRECGIVGIEASSRAIWFEKMLFETGHKLFVGNPVLIRKRATSRHKNDRRDAELILELLLRDEFPVIWRRPPEKFKQAFIDTKNKKAWVDVDEDGNLHLTPRGRNLVEHDLPRKSKKVS